MIHEIGSEKVILITPPYADSGRRPERPQTRIKELVKVTRSRSGITCQLLICIKR